MKAPTKLAVVCRMAQEPVDRTKELTETGANLARQGVVLHALANTAEGMRCWYRGRILVPVETDPDLLMTDLPLVVTVTGVASDLDWVDVTLRASVARSLEVDQYVEDKEVGIQGPETVPVGPCGRLHSGTYLCSGSLRSCQALKVLAERVRLTPPILQSIGRLAGAQCPMAAAISPSQLYRVNSGIHFRLTSVNRELVLTSDAGAGPYEVVVGCTASEPDGSNSVIKELTFAPQGSYTGLRRMDSYHS